MKTAVVIVMALASLECLAAASLKLANIDGWKSVEIGKDPALNTLFKGSDQILLVTDKEDEEAPIVRLKTLGEAPKFSPRNRDAWRKIVFSDQTASQIVLTQALIEVAGQWRYIAEFQTDIGTETMLSSIVMTIVVNGKVRVFLFEQRPAEYKKSLEKVRKLFREVSVSADNI